MNRAAVDQANRLVPVATTPAGRKAWMDAYIEAGGPYKTIALQSPEPQQQATNNPPAVPQRTDPGQQAAQLSLKNQAANQQTSGSADAVKMPCVLSVCTADALIVSEEDRDYKLELTSTQPTALPDNPKNILQVISVWEGISGWHGTSAKEITLMTKECSRAAPSGCSAIQLSGGTVSQQIPPGSGKVKVYCKEPSAHWTDGIPIVAFIIHFLFPDKVEPVIYSVDTVGCDYHSSLHARIEVFPELAWEGATTLSFDSERVVGAAGNEVKSTLALKGELSVQYGGNKYSIEANANSSSKEQLGECGIEGLVKHCFRFIEGASFLKRLNGYVEGRDPIPGVSSKPEINCKLIWPSIKFSGKSGNTEVKDKYMVVQETTSTISVTFLSLEVKGDVFDFLAYLYCPALYTIKKAAQDGVKSEFGEVKAVIGMELSGEVTIKGDLEYKSSTLDQKVTGRISAFGGLGLKGEAYVEGRVWRVYAGAGAWASLMSTKSASERAGFTGTLEPIICSANKGFDWSGSIGFNGLAFYYALYAYYGAKSMKTDQAQEANAGGRRAGADNDLKDKEEQIVKGAELLKSWKYPE
jgi:hypothetical protein